MKRNSTFLFVLFVSLFVSAKNNDSLLKNLRSVPISNGYKITLQSNIETLKKVTSKKNNTLYQLKKGTFSQADSIELEVNKANQITAEYFFYDSIFVYNYKDRVEAFTATFNSAGKEFQFTVEKSAIKVTKWEDRRTIFELVEITTNNIPFFYAVIFDKELYLKGIKKGIDLKNQDNSLELLKIRGLI